VKVSYSKGVATHADPESCVCIRKGADEALTGARAGQVLSCESKINLGGRRSRRIGRQHGVVRYRKNVLRPRVVEDPVQVRKLLTREPGDPVSVLGNWPRGPRCESGRSTTAMHGRREVGQADSS